MGRVEIQHKVWWVIYLIATHTIFTLPDAAVSQKNPVHITPQASETKAGSSTTTAFIIPAAATEPTGAADEPVAQASSFVTVSDNLNVAESSSSFFRGARPQRPPRRFPPPIKAPMPPPPQKPLILKQSSLEKPSRPSSHFVPKRPHKSRHHYSSDLDLSSESNRRPSLNDLSREEIPLHSLEGKSVESKHNSHRDHRHRDREEIDHNRSYIRDEYDPSGGSSGGDSVSVEAKSPPPPPPKSGRGPPHHGESPTHPHPSSSGYHQHRPAPFPKPARPVKLSYFYDSKDKQDLKTLITSHHLKRRGKECDGLENFVYDLEVIGFLMGLVSAIIGLYSDVIPFFNDGVKISYSNNYGDGADFPHEYWNNHDAKIDAVVTKRVSRSPGKQRTISIGTSEDNMREVVSVAGELISLVSLGIGFVALFPSLVEKFFYSLDWWFGKRGLWKQYLYTYKCEIHPYPEVGWSNR